MTRASMLPLHRAANLVRFLNVRIEPAIDAGLSPAIVPIAEDLRIVEILDHG